MCKTIDIDKVRKNIILFKSAGKPIVAVVKSNFYGVGMEYVTSIDDLIAKYAVKNLTEALTLSKLTKKKILILTPIEITEVVSDTQFTYTVASLDQLEKYKESGKEINVAFKVNTVLNRYGMVQYEIDRALESISNSKITLKDIYTHSNSTGVGYEEVNRYMLEIAKSCLKYGTIDIHMHDTSDVVRGNVSKSNYVTHVRVGMGMLGLLPNGTVGKDKLKLSLKYKIKPTDKRQVKVGDKVGYSDVRIKECYNLITLPIGYCVGVPKSLQGHEVTLNGETYIFIAINMDNSIVAINERLYKDIEILKTELTLVGNNDDIKALANSAKTTVEDIVFRMFNGQ